MNLFRNKNKYKNNKCEALTKVLAGKYLYLYRAVNYPYIETNKISYIESKYDPLILTSLNKHIRYGEKYIVKNFDYYYIVDELHKVTAYAGGALSGYVFCDPSECNITNELPIDVSEIENDIDEIFDFIYSMGYNVYDYEMTQEAIELYFDLKDEIAQLPKSKYKKLFMGSDERINELSKLFNAPPSKIMTLLRERNLY